MNESEKPNLPHEGEDKSPKPESEAVLRGKEMNALAEKIEAAIDKGDYELARQLEKGGGFGEGYVEWLFEGSLEGGEPEYWKRAIRIVEVFKIPPDVVEDLVTDVLGRGLSYAFYIDELFPFANNYFPISEEMKIKAGKHALRIAMHNPKGLKKITDYFRSIGIDISS